MKTTIAKKQNSINIAEKNQEILMQIIYAFGWIREVELYIFLAKVGLSADQIRRTSVQLALKGLIKRENFAPKIDESNAENVKEQADEQEPSGQQDEKKDGQKVVKEEAEVELFFYGIYLTVTEKGAESIGEKYRPVHVPPSRWQHDVTASRCLHFLCEYLKQDSFLTEAMIRNEKGMTKAAKCIDGTLMPNRIYFEQERSRKTGPKHLGKQIDDIIAQANLGRDCYVSYPFCCVGQPRFEELNYNHEQALTNAFWMKLAGQPSHNIYFVRNFYENRWSYKRALVSFFQILRVPVPGKPVEVIYTGQPKTAHPYYQFAIPLELD